jgi:hypothetical protein
LENLAKLSREIHGNPRITDSRFEKSSQPFVRTHNETLYVAAMCVGAGKWSRPEHYQTKFDVRVECLALTMRAADGQNVASLALPPCFS